MTRAATLTVIFLAGLLLAAVIDSTHQAERVAALHQQHETDTRVIATDRRVIGALAAELTMARTLYPALPDALRRADGHYRIDGLSVRERPNGAVLVQAKAVRPNGALALFDGPNYCGPTPTQPIRPTKEK